MREPHFGHTRHGQQPVHAHTFDHLPNRTAVNRFNSRLGVAITGAVGSMWCAYLFALLALVSLPAVLTEGGFVHAGFFPHWLVAAGLIALVAWIAQTFLQLVLLSIIIVGQAVQSQAADARAAKTFEDVESVRGDLTTALDRLDEKTEGGIRAVLDAVAALTATPQAVLNSAITLDETQIRQLVEAIQANAAPPEGGSQAARDPSGTRQALRYVNQPPEAYCFRCGRHRPVSPVTAWCGECADRWWQEMAAEGERT